MHTSWPSVMAFSQLAVPCIGLHMGSMCSGKGVVMTSPSCPGILLALENSLAELHVGAENPVCIPKAVDVIPIACVRSINATRSFNLNRLQDNILLLYA